VKRAGVPCRLVDGMFPAQEGWVWDDDSFSLYGRIGGRSPARRAGDVHGPRPNGYAGSALSPSGLLVEGPALHGPNSTPIQSRSERPRGEAQGASAQGPSSPRGTTRFTSPRGMQGSASPSGQPRLVGRFKAADKVEAVLLVAMLLGLVGAAAGSCSDETKYVTFVGLPIH
jgi:hypothetical protein